MTEPMVRILHSKCPECGRINDSVMTWHGTGEVLWRYGDTVPVELVRAIAQRPVFCRPEKGGCGAMAFKLFATEPVPGMGTPYPATERDEDSEYEFAREDAPLWQEDRR